LIWDFPFLLSSQYQFRLNRILYDSFKIDFFATNKNCFSQFRSDPKAEITQLVLGRLYRHGIRISDTNNPTAQQIIFFEGLKRTIVLPLLVCQNSRISWLVKQTIIKNTSLRKSIKNFYLHGCSERSFSIKIHPDYQLKVKCVWQIPIRKQQ
jgi:hypothetical protein